MVELNKKVTCTSCMGDKYKKRHCSHCQGKGYIVFVRQNEAKAEGR